MAGNRITHATTGVGTPTTVTVNGDYGALKVINRGTAEVYATASGSAATVAGDDMEVILGGQSGLVENTARTQYDQGAGTRVPSTTTTISLISVAAQPVTVVGVSV